MVRSIFSACAAFSLTAVLSVQVLAQTPGAGAPPPGSTPPIPAYATWTKDAQKQSGLFTVWRKDGKVYLELSSDQLDKDYLETGANANGLGGFGIVSGQMFQQIARLIRFIRTGRTVAVVWPQTRFSALPNTPLADAVRLSTADSVAGMAPIVAEEPLTKAIVVDMSFLLGDVMNFTDTLHRLADPKDPLTAFHLDPARTYFGPAKAFPKNVVIEADETFAAPKAQDRVNTMPDARSIQMRAVYNFIALPENDGFMPRLADDRIGYFEDTHIAFENTAKSSDDYVRYMIRWNVQPSDPTKPISPAKTPIVYTLSNSIPVQYREPIRRAVLEWNKAFERIGISDVIRVQDQPSDPNWDPDDVRYNVIRWITEATPSFGAEAQLVWDPRTGECFRGGVLIENVLVRGGGFQFDALNPNGSEPMTEGHHFAVHDDGIAMAQQLGYGAYAQALMTGGDPQAFMQKDAPDLMFSVVLHEVGHDWGLMHNFIGHEAYTLAQLRNKQFTDRYGISTSAMDYTPFNLAPAGAHNGDVFQATLGPYDYHAIAYGYSIIPHAATPQDEVPALNRIASKWSAPEFRFSSDEDVEWANGHAVDPRVEWFVLSNDTLGWCNQQLGIVHGLLQKLDSRFPRNEHSWDEERAAFAYVMSPYGRCTLHAAHFLGGEYLSRARVGDPHADLPLTPVSRTEELRAFAMVNRYLFANDAWNFSPTTLRRLVYSEHEPFLDFGYQELPRLDVSVSAVAERFQDAALAFMYQPMVLARIADLPATSARGATMTLADLFTWNQNAIYGDLRNGSVARATVVRRNLQRRYALLLAHLSTAPPKGTPYDAQALARYELVDLQARIAAAQRTSNDVQTRAHLAAMRADVTRALRPRQNSAPEG